MAKAFKDSLGQEIGIKLECKIPYPSGDGEPVSMSMDDIFCRLVTWRQVDAEDWLTVFN
jgi:hypothetical protein